MHEKPLEDARIHTSGLALQSQLVPNVNIVSLNLQAGAGGVVVTVCVVLYLSRPAGCELLMTLGSSEVYSY